MQPQEDTEASKFLREFSQEPEQGLNSMQGGGRSQRMQEHPCPMSSMQDGQQRHSPSPLESFGLGRAGSHFHPLLCSVSRRPTQQNSSFLWLIKAHGSRCMSDTQNQLKNKGYLVIWEAPVWSGVLWLSHQLDLETDSLDQQLRSCIPRGIVHTCWIEKILTLHRILKVGRAVGHRGKLHMAQTPPKPISWNHGMV